MKPLFIFAACLLTTTSIAQNEQKKVKAELTIEQWKLIENALIHSGNMVMQQYNGTMQDIASQVNQHQTDSVVKEKIQPKPEK